MSGEVPVPYVPPPKPEAPKHFAGLLLGIILCIVGALVIYQGIDIAAKDAEKIAPSMGLLAAGFLLMFAGVSKVWPGRALVNAGLIIVGIVCLVGSGALLHDVLREAASAILLTIIGIALIVFGVEVAKERWKRFIAR